MRTFSSWEDLDTKSGAGKNGKATGLQVTGRELGRILFLYTLRSGIAVEFLERPSTWKERSRFFGDLFSKGLVSEKYISPSSQRFETWQVQLTDESSKFLDTINLMDVVDLLTSSGYQERIEELVHYLHKEELCELLTHDEAFVRTAASKRFEELSRNGTL